MLQSVAYVALLAVNLALCRAGQNTVELAINFTNTGLHNHLFHTCEARGSRTSLLPATGAREAEAIRQQCITAGYHHSHAQDGITQRPDEPSIAVFSALHDPVLGEVST